MIKEAIIAPMSNFTTSSFEFKIIRTRDYRFHDIKFPLRETRAKQQLLKYREIYPDITEEQYRTMIFGSPEGSETATIKDPSEGANLIRVGEDVLVDVVESDFIDIGKVVEIGTREMESVELVEDSAVTPDSLPVPEVTNPVPEVTIPVPEVTVPDPEIEVKKLSEAEIRIEKDRKYDINRYKFFDSKRKPAKTGSSSSSSSSGNIQSAAPTMAEFA